ncbi:hypothetical protein BK120_08430 [Paenibacillus sp. FSL A5-0031]|uniref:hypothetical protein n=1 Tax=Paenibacillus sp. FSL A5-0031 TaxID=1920420 RepID=UPI00096FD57C|nr:hypothetical protein [Paenibacillus sp. FSL A5-0031]OME86940.1 hypothetical protein BK120_08430 [Paenibacillus sp. FSL A5-0031]
MYSEEEKAKMIANRMQNINDGRERWSSIISSIFSGVPVSKKTWNNSNDIVETLNILAKVKNTNHVFCPRGGGFDLTGSRLSVEANCIELLSDGSTTIVKPESLTFYPFGSDSQFYYFRLETRELDPSGVYDHISGGYEEVCELSPGEYVDRSIWDYGYYGSDEDGNEQPLDESARPVIREFNGSFVIFGKYSDYNLDSGTYDGRHNKKTAIEFANYIRNHTDHDALQP